MDTCNGQWGCSCPECKDRKHPMDLMARITRQQQRDIEAWQAELARLAANRRTGCTMCGKPGRLYKDGIRCPAHKPVRWEDS